MSIVHTITRLSMELGLAISDYNSHLTDSLDEIIKITIAYLAKVKEGVRQGMIQEEDVPEYFSLVGQSWSCIQFRGENEFLGPVLVSDLK